ncbi:hypothetical protein AMTRI_Chr11g98950 [Amborella trichopoda]|uniref:Thioredoxin domain-containing protein n=1 Tax=Amborella trichopoda TaxID=13333 RepID=W1PLV7_AMBTC|nr:uncharacterized protein LOC18436790 [Amborella trichopoda]ERN08656.1 hypothetical protein AMTR_s00017p00209370 [Amborella trichopoda]|eukprot:XP_006847075.1 uncharacterized protein LOC18436790 [Amborella trichopoda]
MSSATVNIRISSTATLTRPGSPYLLPASSSLKLTVPSSYMIRGARALRAGLRIGEPDPVSPFLVRRRRGSGNFVCGAQDALAQAVEVTESSWKDSVLESEVPVVVEFWAPWCGPCRMIEPLIDEIARQYVGKVKCFKLNTDESPQVATDYGIRSIPTVLLFKNGEKQDTVIGAVPKSALVATIEKHLVS